jgi:hypothetical protein
MILEPVLNADYEAIVEAGIANTSQAIRSKIGYLGECIFHQCRISNPLHHRGIIHLVDICPAHWNLVCDRTTSEMRSPSFRI